MPDYDMSPMRTRRTTSNNGIDIRKKASKIRPNTMRPVSVEHSNSFASTSSSSSSTFQNENDNRYQNQPEHKHEYENEHRPASLYNSYTQQRMGYLDNTQAACDKELPSPATQMSFSYLRQPEHQSPSSMRFNKTPFRNRFFASAALVSNQHDRQHQQHQHSRKIGWEKFTPPNSTGVSWGSIINWKNKGCNSKSATSKIDVEVPTRLVVKPKDSLSRGNNRELSYESFGNHSVYSDLSGSEFSDNFSCIPPKERQDYDVIQERETSVPQDALHEVVDDLKEGGLEYEEEKDQQIDALYRRKQIEIAKGRGNRAQDGVHVGLEHEKKSPGRGKNMSSRIASLFLSNGVNNAKSGERTDKVTQELADIRVNSTPREMIIPTSSPTRSNVSIASSRYEGWPGTLDKHGSTLETSSNFSAEDRSISKKNDLNVGDNLVTNPSSKIRNRHRINYKSTSTSPKGTVILDKETDNESERIITQSISRSNIAKVKLKYEGDAVDLDDDELSSNHSGTGNPADFHLAAVVADATSPPQSVQDMKAPTTEQSTFSELGTNYTHTHPMTSKSLVQGRHHNQHGTQSNSIITAKEYEYETRHSVKQENNPHLVGEIYRQKFPFPAKVVSMTNKETMGASKVIDTRASLHRIQSAGREMRPIHQLAYSSPNKQVKPLRHTRMLSYVHSTNYTHLSENALKENDRLTPVHIRGSTFKGYRGFLDKTKDVPNLIDNDIDSVTTASTHAIDNDAFNMGVQQGCADEESEIFDDLHSVSASSDVFDGLHSISGSSDNFDSAPNLSKLSTYNSKLVYCTNVQNDGNRNKEHKPEDGVGRLGIQKFWSTAGQSKPKTDFDCHDTDNKIRIPLETLPEGDRIYYSHDHDSLCSGSTSGESWTDLSKYAVEPSQIRKLVRKFRNMSKVLEKKGENSSYEDDSKRAFALFELRSRVMETDIRRGLERTGGTVVVDDIILTSHNQAAHRIRDAIIVSKAWRDGASPKDARTASLLMNSDAIHHIKRVVRPNCNSASPSKSLSNDISSSNSTSSNKIPHPLYSWEKVLWIDDTQFSLLRCPSLGPRSMRGFEMFTIGDCQSILLKLTNERCEELREVLKKAISRQLFAEQSLGEELDVDDESDLNSFMTDAETTYLQAMEDVKIIAQNLSNAEKSFHMVRDKIEKLVMKYETLLEEIGNDEDSVISLKSDISTDNEDNCIADKIDYHLAEKEKLKRRAQRAELKAEVAVREAEKSKQEAEKIKYEKQEELETLQRKLEELETKSAHMASEFEMKLNNQKLWANSTGNGSSSSQNSIPLTIDSASVSATGAHSLLYAASHIGLDQEKIDAKIRIKKRFRQRNTQGSSNLTSIKAVSVSGVSKNKQKLTGKVHQRLEFYERSLQAVKK